MTDTDDIAIGVGLGSFGGELPEPSELFRYVERADELGIDSLWMPDHALSEGPALDPAVLMSAIAARTRSIKMGPSVLALPGRNPVAVANTYASLDHLTGGRGRVIAAVGLGADPRLAGTVGIAPEERPGRLREAVEILRALWTEDDVDYEGEYYQLRGASVNPKPAGGPLDVWIGGNSDAALRRVAEYGDGWFPSGIPVRVFEERLGRLMDYCEEVGREVERDEVGLLVRTHVDPDPERAREVRDRYLDGREIRGTLADFEESSAFGTSAACVETLRRYVDAGCTKFVLLPVGPVTERVEQLERYSRDVIAEVAPPR